MAARVRLKMQCGTAVVLPIVFLAIVYSVDKVSGMFEHRHCSHQHPRVHEVSLINFLIEIQERRTILTSFSHTVCLSCQTRRHQSSLFPSRSLSSLSVSSRLSLFFRFDSSDSRNRVNECLL